MNYPLISEYVDSIRSAEDNFDKLSGLRPVLDDNGNPVMSSGNFAVVFKMKDVNTSKLYKGTRGARGSIPKNRRRA